MEYSLFQRVTCDFGCGESPYQSFLLQYAKSYTAVERTGSQHITQRTILADLNKELPIERNVAETVVSFSVFEHLYNPQTMINEVLQVLNPMDS